MCFSRPMREPPLGWAGLACALLLAGGFLGPRALAVELFGPAAVSLRVGSSPGVVTVADLNDDGILDLAVPSFDDDAVSILLGDGLGGFARMPAGPAAGLEPFSIATGDFNTDGAADLAVANSGGDSVTVLLGDGAGRFEPAAADIAVGTTPLSIVVEDFNADGAADLAVANRFGNSVSILLGDGRGGQTRNPQDIAVGTEPFSIGTGDFDGDGDADLAVCNFGSGSDSLSVLMGDGLGGFVRAAQDIFIGNRPISVAVDDFDRDGHVDLAVATLFGDAVRILLGDGLGGFALDPEVIAVGSRPFALAARDFNGDGAPDLAATNFLGNSVSVLLNDGASRFARSPDLAVGHVPRSVAAGDFNRDGAVDLAVSNFAGGSVNILLGDGIGDFSRSVDFSVGLSPREIAAGDLDGDGSMDLAVASFADDTVSIVLGDGSGGYHPASEVGVGGGPTSVAIGDLNADGVPDLVVANFIDRSVSILLGDGQGEFVSAPDVGVGSGPRSVAVGDFSGDGKVDLAVANQSAGQLEATLSVLLGDGRGGFERMPDVGVGGAGSEPSFVVAGEFNGDGAADLAVSKLGSDSVSILLGDGSGGFARAADIGVGSEPSSVAGGDFDGDGVVDLAVANSGGASVSILAGNGAGGFTRTLDAGTGNGPFAVAVEDLNADGAADLVVSSLDDDLVTILLGDGRGGFSRVAEDIAVGPFPFAITAQDLNADGEIDLAVVNESATDEFGDRLTLLFNQLPARADVNGSNRVNGFDISFVGRLFGLRSPDAAYRRNVDVNLDGLIDGDDLALVGHRFGEPNKVASPLRAHLDTALPADPATVTPQPVASEGDLLTVEIVVNDNGFDPVAAADFVLTFNPDPGDPNQAQVLEVLDSFEPGTYLAGGATPIYILNTGTPGAVRVSISRIPNLNRSGPGVHPLLNLFFRAKRTGKAVLEFAPSGDRPRPSLLNASGEEVPGVNFVAGARVTVDASVGGPPGQRIGFAPELLDLADVEPRGSARKSLAISNFGFSELEVSSVSSTLPEFGSLPASGFVVPAFGFVDVPVAFSPTAAGIFSGFLTVDSDDPRRPRVRIPVLGRSGLDLGLVPSSLEFGRVAVGAEKTVALRLTNREQAPLTLTSLSSSDPALVLRAGFSILGPGETGTVEVTFRPAAAGDLLGVLTIGFDAPGDKTVVMSVLGEGEPAVL